VLEKIAKNGNIQWRGLGEFFDTSDVDPGPPAS